MVGTATGGMIATTITIDFISLSHAGGPPTRAAPRFITSRRSGTAALNYIGAYAVLSLESMKFENDKGEQVEVNFQNFERILPAAKAGYTPVKLKNGKEEWLLATENEILEATAEE
jgi:ABC-type sulfate transport system substrate-binding protein